MAKNTNLQSVEGARFAEYRSITEQRFKDAVKLSAEVSVLVSQVQKAGEGLPPNDAVLASNTVDDWLGPVNGQIQWDFDKAERVCSQYAAATPENRVMLKSELGSAISKINLEPGLFTLTNSKTFFAAYRTKPYYRTRAGIFKLETELRRVAVDVLASSIEEVISNVEILATEFALNGDAESVLNDVSGTIGYKADSEYIEIAFGPDPDQHELRSLVKEILDDLSTPNNLMSVGQRSSRAVALLENYKFQFESSSESADLKLYSAGVRLAAAMDSLNNPTFADERPSEEFLGQLRALLDLHETFIWSFPRIRGIIEYRRRTIASYSSDINSNAETEKAVLGSLGAEGGPVGPRTKDTIADLNKTASESPKIVFGLDALQYGVLRGALQFMGQLLLRARKASSAIVTSTATKVVSGALAAAVFHSPLYTNVINFVSAHAHQLIQLATSYDWSWVKFLL